MKNLTAYRLAKKDLQEFLYKLYEKYPFDQSKCKAETLLKLQGLYLCNQDERRIKIFIMNKWFMKPSNEGIKRQLNPNKFKTDGNNLLGYDKYLDRYVTIASRFDDAVRPTHGYFCPHKLAKHSKRWADFLNLPFRQD